MGDNTSVKLVRDKFPSLVNLEGFLTIYLLLVISVDLLSLIH